MLIKAEFQDHQLLDDRYCTLNMTGLVIIHLMLGKKMVPDIRLGDCQVWLV